MCVCVCVHAYQPNCRAFFLFLCGPPLSLSLSLLALDFMHTYINAHAYIILLPPHYIRIPSDDKHRIDRPRIKKNRTGGTIWGRASSSPSSCGRARYVLINNICVSVYLFSSYARDFHHPYCGGVVCVRFAKRETTTRRTTTYEDIKRQPTTLSPPPKKHPHTYTHA